ncbi:MAG: AraC family transcriptional regulator ligand-binding domain-containing protein [Pseudomonadota bacterium]
MPAYSPTLPVRYTALLWQYMQEIDCDPVRLFAEAGLAPGLPVQEGGSITLSELHALLKAIERVTGRRDQGYEVGRRINFANHGTLGQAMQACATLDHALRMAARYASLITPAFVIEYRRHAGHGELSYRPVAPMAPELMYFMFEAHAVASHHLMAMLLGSRLGAYDMHFSMQAPAHVSRYRQLAPVRVHFGVAALPEVRMLFSAALLDAPVLSAAPDMALASEKQCKTQLGNEHLDLPWSEWVRLILHEAEHCQPTIEQLAQLLGIGPHTLSRRLQREKHNFRVLSNEVRFERACRLLAGSSTPISHIAYRLGYQGVAAFSEAFRRMAGHSPRHYRAQQRTSQ